MRPGFFSPASLNVFRCASLVMFGMLAGISHVRAATEKPPAEKPSALELTLSTNEPSNLFYEDALTPSQPVTLSIHTHNKTGKAGTVGYAWKLTDYWGKTVRMDRTKSPNVAADGTDEWFLSFHHDADLKGNTGFYTFQITAQKGKEKAEAKTSFGVIPRPAAGLRERSLFGVAAGVEERTLPALQKIGARWLRTDSGVNWHDCEAKFKGEYDWDRFDRLATETAAHDLMLLPILDYAPVWAQPKDSDGKPMQYLDAPINVQDHADFMAAAVARYAKEIKYWETWNEPYVMGWNWKNTAQHFRDMMKADYDAAKKANPNAVVIASGGSASHLRDVVFIPGADMSADVDETSSHTYGAGAPEDDFFAKAQDSVRVSRAHGKDKVWITEQGWTLDDSPKMAQYVPRTYVLAALAGVTQLDWFTLADDTMGLFDKAFRPRAGAVAYAVAAHFLDNGLLVKDLWPHSRRIYGGVFKNPSGLKTAAVWAVGDHGSLTLENAKGIEAYDLMGAKTGNRVGDKLEVPLGEDAVYLTSSGDQAEFLEQLGKARIVGITPVEIVAEPFLASISKTPPIRVQVTNMLNRPIDGDVQASAPKGWKLADSKAGFGPLEPGQTAVVEIPVRQATITPDNAYPVTVWAESRHKGVSSFFVRLTGPEWRISRDQTLHLAGATPGTPTVDGDLSDWPADALAVQANTKASVSPWAPEGYVKAWTPGNLSATFYTRYDENNFYVAAKVTDNVHSALSVRENPYNFPFDGDSLQVAFGYGEQQNEAKRTAEGELRKNRDLLDETQDEFSFALTAKGPEVFRLRTPESGPVTYYPTNPDLGLGLTDKVKLAAKRDEVSEVTTYEAAIPWSELNRLPHTQPFHLAFKMNDKDRAGEPTGWIESAAGAGVVRSSPLSFSPSWQYTTANLSEWTLLDRPASEVRGP